MCVCVLHMYIYPLLNPQASLSSSGRTLNPRAELDTRGMCGNDIDMKKISTIYRFP